MSLFGSYPTTVPSLDFATHTAIIDALSRAVNSYDTNDLALHDSAFLDSPETTFDLAGQKSVGLPAIQKIIGNVGPLDTTHVTGNHRIIEYNASAGTARLTATAIAQHCPPGEGTKPDGKKFLAGSLYDLELVKDGEVWKIKEFRMKIMWTEGDYAVMSSASKE